MLADRLACMSSVKSRVFMLSASSGTRGHLSPGRGPQWTNSIARCRSAAASNGRYSSAAAKSRKPLPGTCAPIMPGRPIARSNSAAAVSRSASGSEAKATKRPGWAAQIALTLSL